jgi:hypothetical protein
MSLNLPRAVRVVINLVVDDNLAMWRRIDAAEVLLQAAVPDQVVDATRRFLLEIAENPTNNPGHRLAAARAVLKRDLGKFKRARIEPVKYDALRGMRDVTAAELIENGLRRTAKRDATLERDRQQLRLVSSVPDPPVDKAG